MLKSSNPVTDYMTEINIMQLDDAKDLDVEISIYGLIEHVI